MSRHSASLPIELDAGVPIKIGTHSVIVTCGDSDADPDKMKVRELYVSRSTGKLVIVFENEEV